MDDSQAHRDRALSDLEHARQRFEEAQLNLQLAQGDAAH